MKKKKKEKLHGKAFTQKEDLSESQSSHWRKTLRGNIAEFHGYILPHLSGNHIEIKTL